MLVAGTGEEGLGPALGSRASKERGANGKEKEPRRVPVIPAVSAETDQAQPSSAKPQTPTC